MPQELMIDDSSLGDDGMKILEKEELIKTNYVSYNELKQFNDLYERLEKRDNLKEALDLGQKYIDNIQKYGYKTWYEWSIKNWGTKWNAYECKLISPTTIEFQTAWNGVISLLEKLSTLFPVVEFEYMYADEDTGNNCGMGVIKNGEAAINNPTSYSKEAYELAFELWPSCKEYYHLEEDGTYNYNEDEE